jgi:peptide/histidine transporter 3/4
MSRVIDERSRLTGGDSVEDDEPKKKGSTLINVCSFIIVNEFCERLAFYGFQGSLVLFMKKQLGFSNADAATQMIMWNGCCYITPLLGGYIADAYIGRYKAILYFMSIYFVGMVGVCISANAAHPNVVIFFIAIYTTALGTGGIKPNVSTLGADQFEGTSEKVLAEKSSFFSWFYWAINLGAIFSFTIVAQLCQNVSFAIGYTVPAAFMGLSIVVFVIGSPRYIKKPPQGSPFGQAAGILWQATVSAASAAFSDQKQKHKSNPRVVTPGTPGTPGGAMHVSY